MKRARGDALTAFVAALAPAADASDASNTANIMERLNWDGTTEAASDALYPLARNIDNHVALAGTVVPLMSLAAPSDEELILRMLDNDLLDKVFSYIARYTHTPVWLACKGVHARRPTGEPMKTSVRAMYATPAMFAWASDNDCPPPQSRSRRMSFDALHAICELEPASRAPWVGALFQWMKHPLIRVSDFAEEIVSGIDVASLAPHADTIAGFLCDTDGFVRTQAMRILERLEPLAITRHVSAIVQLLDELADDIYSYNFVFFALHALRKLERDARAPYVYTIARAIERSFHKGWTAWSARDVKMVHG